MSSYYIVFGTAAGYPNPLPLASLDGTNGVYFNAPWQNGNGSVPVAVGDINGDGIADMLFGESGAGTNSPSVLAFGAVYVVFGHTGTWPAQFDLVTLDGTNGFLIKGIAANDKIGYSATLADINDDGKADIIFGGHIGIPPFTGVDGKVYAVFGRAGSWNAAYGNDDATLFDGTNGFILNGANNENTGADVAAGDINNDNINDLLIGAPFGSYGRAYVVFGKSTAGRPVPTSTLSREATDLQSSAITHC